MGWTASQRVDRPEERHGMKLAAAALVLVFGSTAFADLVSNGGFEIYLDTNNGGTIPTSAFSFSTMSPSDSSLTGWTLGGSGIDLIQMYWVNHGNGHSIDLASTGDGSISQTLTTVVGQIYELRFWMAGIPTGGPTVKTLDVTLGSTTFTNVAFDSSSSSTGSMGWTEMVFKWTATSTSSTLQFTSTSGTNSGPALDDISVNAVPEPAALALFGLGLGAGAFGLWRRRVARRAAAS
jgi:choice-of-anchor C domain-containing protein